MALASERLHRISTDVYERIAAVGLLPTRGIELLDGLVVHMSPKGDRHSHAVNTLNAQFGDQRRGRYIVNAQSLSLRLSPHDEPEPDIALARTTRSYASERAQPADIALIVEVSDSSLAFDLVEKCRMYAAAAIPEYWVVDVPHNCIHLFRDPRSGDYALRTQVEPPERVSPQEFPDVHIDVAAVVGSID